MTDPDSRHAPLPSYRRELPGSGEVELWAPRLRPAAADPPGRSHRVEPGQRVDHLAHRLLGDPYQWWRLADANPEVPVADLGTPGGVIAVPERS
jgi:hypothetical protein